MLQAKYSEVSDLPLVLDYSSLIHLVVAHRIHGQQMRTGWPIEPGRLSHRKDAHNHILIEMSNEQLYQAQL